jgi:hypothetical protein
LRLCEQTIGGKKIKNQKEYFRKEKKSHKLKWSLKLGKHHFLPFALDLKLMEKVKLNKNTRHTKKNSFQK